MMKRKCNEELEMGRKDKERRRKDILEDRGKEGDMREDKKEENNTGASGYSGVSGYSGDRGAGGGSG